MPARYRTPLEKGTVSGSGRQAAFGGRDQAASAAATILASDLKLCFGGADFLEAFHMWQRMKRVFRSMFGWMISAAEDPELILEQNIRDLNDQVPKMNESIAMVKANVTLLEKENQKYKNDTVELTSKVKAAIQANRDDIATTYATQLQTTKAALMRNEQQLMAARQAFEKAMQVKQAFMQEMGMESPAAEPAAGDKTLGKKVGVQ